MNGRSASMIKVKTFSTQIKIFHTRNELEELDRQVNEFIASHGVRKVISVRALAGKAR